MTMASDIITVAYEFVDGAHFFTSDDPVAKGLCAAHQDLKTAFDETGIQLSKLLKLNQGIETEVVSLSSFEEIKQMAEAAQKVKTDHIRPRLTSEIDWQRHKRAA